MGGSCCLNNKVRERKKIVEIWRREVDLRNMRERRVRISRRGRFWNEYFGFGWVE